MPVFEKTTFSPSAHTRNAPPPLPDSLMQSNQLCRPPTTSCSPHDPLSRYPTAPLCKAGKPINQPPCAKREKPTNQPPLCKARKTHKPAPPPCAKGGSKGGNVSPSSAPRQNRPPYPLRRSAPPPLTIRGGMRTGRDTSPFQKGRYGWAGTSSRPHAA